jgi:hypothetical protein
VLEKTPSKTSEERVIIYDKRLLANEPMRGDDA